jgi:ABC-type bacteriocin/lantibiotic exporter with double-glycine peptidase domain
VPYIPQLEAVECGAACLAMVLAHYGHHAPLAEVREACAVSRDGVNALAMVRAAESYGLGAQAYRAELEGLERIPLPAILHWEFNHFVVLERLAGNGGAHIIDPAQGRIRVSREVLAKSFTGAVLVFTPTAVLRPRRRQPPNLQRYREVLRAHAGSLGQLVAFSLLLQIAGIVFPVGQQFLVDHVLVPRQESWLWSVAAALALAALVQATLQFARGWVLDSLQTILDVRLLGDFMRHVVRLPMGFFLQRRPGDLLQRLESNRALRAFLGSQIATSVLDVFLIVGYGALMMVYHWKLGLLVVVIGCVRALLQFALRGLSRQVVAVELAALSRAGGTLVESLGALETIKSVSAEAVAIRRWSDLVVTRANASLPRLQLENTAVQLTGLLNAIGIAAVSAVAGYDVIAGGMSIGVFTAFLTLQGLYLTPFNSLIESLEHWQYLNSHLARLNDVMETEPEPSGDLDATAMRGEIRLEGVGFRYAPGAPWVLRGIDAHILPGEKIAIVGPSGAGKSTLARILLGVLAPSEGALSFDGQDMRRYDLGKLRARMGAVLQETSLLSDTVHVNISLGDPSLSPAQVKAAAQLACVDDVIETLPRGYATRLGENGMQLSGGERQRVCLARALAHRPAVLLLDEATSALDAETERRVHANLGAPGCTRIVIAHRFSTVRDADRILVVDRGRIVQEGTFDALRDQPGLFRTLLGSLEDPIV